VLAVGDVADGTGDKRALFGLQRTEADLYRKFRSERRHLRQLAMLMQFLKRPGNRRPDVLQCRTVKNGLRVALQ
jgi:hypothetical protein